MKPIILVSAILGCVVTFAAPVSAQKTVIRKSAVTAPTMGAQYVGSTGSNVDVSVSTKHWLSVTGGDALSTYTFYAYTVGGGYGSNYSAGTNNFTVNTDANGDGDSTTFAFMQALCTYYSIPDGVTTQTAYSQTSLVSTPPGWGVGGTGHSESSFTTYGEG